MIKRFLVHLLLKWYVKRNTVIEKLSIDETIGAYTFNSSDKVEKILRYEMTNLTLKYFEEHGNKDVQAVLKGQALAYRLLLDKHKKAKYLMDKYHNNSDKRKQVWSSYIINSWNDYQPK